MSERDTEYMFSHLKNEQLIMKALALLLRDCDLRAELLRRTNGYSMASKNMVDQQVEEG